MSVFIPPELKKKEQEVQKYLIGMDKFKEGTPDYIKEYYKELMDYFSEVDDIL